MHINWQDISGHNPPLLFTLIFPAQMVYGIIPLRPLCTIGVLIPFSNIESSAGYMGILAIQMMDEMEWVLNLAVAETHGEALPLP
jgi:hypothetical protein